MRRILILLALVVFALPMLAAKSPQAASYRVYLPLVRSFEPIQIEGLRLRPVTFCSSSVVGWIRNVSSRPIYDVRIEVRMNDVVETVAPALPATFPGEMNPFSASRFVTPEGCDSRKVTYTATIRSYATSSPIDYRPVSVLSTRSDAGTRTVSGVIQNTESTTLSDVRVVVANQAGIAVIATLDPHDGRDGRRTLALGARANYAAQFGFFQWGGGDYWVRGQGVVRP